MNYLVYRIVIIWIENKVSIKKYIFASDLFPKNDKYVFKTTRKHKFVLSGRIF